MRSLIGFWDALGMLGSIVIFFTIMIIIGYFSAKSDERKIKESKLFPGGYEG